jgi:transmembrane sensor
VSGATVAQVLAEIGRYHRGYIVLRDPELATRMVSGTYDLTRPVEAARAVMEAMGGRLIEITPFLAVATR